MKKIILQLFAFGLLFAIGQGLKCYECKVGLWNLCFTTVTTCNGTEQCYTFSATTAGVVVKTMGCLPTHECNKSTNFVFPPSSNNTLFKMSNKCCISDLCNAAPGLPGTSSVGLALATITALLMTQVMV